MKIAIIGAGAMGSLYGALLKEAGAQVWLLDIWAEHVDAINSRGLAVERDGQTRRVEIQAVTGFGDIPGPVDLVIIFVKSGATAKAAQTAAKLMGDHGLVLTLQNGLGNADAIAGHVPADRILAGTTAQGATLMGPGAIRHAGTGPTLIGFWSGGSPKALIPLADLMIAAGIETELMEDVRALIWNKLIVNVGINAITALTGIKNGQLLDQDSTRELCRRAVAEAEAVARSLDIAVMTDAAEHVFQVARATGPNRSSMGQDVDNRRRTEIDTINGAVSRLAVEQGLDAPVNFALTALVKTLQSHYDG